MGEKQGRGSKMRTGQRYSKVVKFGLRWWSWRQRLVDTREVTPRSWRRCRDHARTPVRTRTPTRPRVLLASRAPAAAVPASRRPSRPRAAARPPGLPARAQLRPAPPVCPPPGPVPPPSRRGQDSGGEMRPRGRITRRTGVCARVGLPGPVPRLRSLSPRVGAPLCPAPPAAAGPPRGEGRGWPGPSCGRAQRAAAAAGDHPSPSRPGLEAAQCRPGTRLRGAGGGLGQFKAAQALANTWAAHPAPPCLSVLGASVSPSLRPA